MTPVYSGYVIELTVGGRRIPETPLLRRNVVGPLVGLLLPARPYAVVSPASDGDSHRFNLTVVDHAGVPARQRKRRRS